MSLILTLLTASPAQAAPPESAPITPPFTPAPPADLAVDSVLDFVVKGGPVMIPIGLCSLVALAVIIERLAALRRRQVIPPAFLPGLKAVLRNPRTDRPQALEYCARAPSPVARVFAAGIKRLGEPLDLLERHISEAGEREVLLLRRRLRTLSVIASVSPLLGLLGTIFGMISAFQTVAMSAEALGKTELLAKGIYEAMITTAAGLIVAIPVILAYQWFVSRIETLIADIDRMTVEFVEDYALAQPERPAPEPKPRLIDPPSNAYAEPVAVSA